MKIIHCKNLREYRDEIIEIKNIDSDFCYNKEKNELFILKSNGDKVYGYGLIDITNKVAELKRIFIISQLRNNGYGTFLLKNIINWLINNNYDQIVVKNHKQMNNFLEKQRFIKSENGYELNNLTEHKKEEKKLFHISKIAIIINIILAFLKILTGNLFKSSSLLSDGLNSLSDLITNIIVILGLKVGGNPEDKEHPFGHGKIESVFSVIIGTFVMLTAFDLCKENIKNLIYGKEGISVTPLVIIVTLLALIIKILQFVYIKQKTKNYKGALINSLLKDYKADIIITISVLLGIILSKINPIFDIIIGLIVAIYILKEGYELIYENSLVLLDSQDEELLEKIKNDISEFPEVKNAHEFRMTTSGKNIYVYADLRVDQNLTVDEAHEITNKISKTIKMKYKNVKRVLFHVEPMYENKK